MTFAAGGRAVRTHWLTCHLGYACRHSGACCSSRWPIPIERDRAKLVARDIAAGRVRPVVDPWLTPAIGAPEEVAGTLTLTDRGACTFYRTRNSGLSDSVLPTPDFRLRQGNGGQARLPTPAAGGCAIHPIRPRSCAHFPYVCLIDSRGVRVTLSHYCPTAAAMLVDHTGALEIVEGPPVFEDGSVPEGLDARDVLPPLEAPGRLVDVDRFTEWERLLVRSLGAGESALLRSPASPAVELFDLARDAVPLRLGWPDAPEDLERTWAEVIAPEWPRIAPIAGRYLAARAFASWVAYQGAGLPAVEHSLAIADAVFRVELARQVGQVGRVGLVERRLVGEALRQSDLLLVHHVDPCVLARAC
jgi:Fe-S-cluster containining protein